MPQFTEDQELILDSVKEFCKEQIEPLVPVMEAGDFPMELLAQMRELGYPNCSIAEEWGGLGESMTLHVAMEIEMAKQCLTVALYGCSNPIATLVTQVGTQEQKELFMPGLIAGGGGLGFTEPTAG